jgi:hypothetical protein
MSVNVRPTRDKVFLSDNDYERPSSFQPEAGLEILLADQSRDEVCGEGGFSEDELFHASSCRVYEDPADLLKHIDVIGG